jgi:hypothetical protein
VISTQTPWTHTEYSSYCGSLADAEIAADGERLLLDLGLELDLRLTRAC